MNLGFWFAEGAKGLFHHRLTAAITIIGMTFALWTFGFLYLAQSNLAQYEEKVLSGFQLETFLETTTIPGEHQQIWEQISAFDGIIDIKYVSKEEAAQIFAQEFGDELFNILQDNPLPASFKITIDPEYFSSQKAEQLIQKIQRLPGVDDVVFHGNLLDMLKVKFELFTKLFLALGALLLAASMLVFLQGIRLSILARKNFVNTLLLSGAKFSSLKIPFVIEGTITGIIAGGLAYAGLKIIQLLINHFFISFDFHTRLYLLLPAGIILGLIGALTAVNRNLKGYLYDKRSYNF